MSGPSPAAIALWKNTEQPRLGQRKDQRLYLPVSAIRTPALFSLSASATVAEAITTMTVQGANHLVVTADTHVAGLG